MSMATKDFPYRAARVPGRDLRTPHFIASALGTAGQLRALSPRRRRDVFRAVLLVVSGLLVSTAFGLSARAGGTHVLVIPADDGYGLSDCLTENASCGPMVAGAWCKAKGHGTSGTFGPVSAAATATDTSLAAAQGPRGFAITCHE
jgi:hypothetical protein